MSDFVTNVTDQSFEHDVLQSEQPVLVDFWAEWCQPCRMLAPTVDAIAQTYQGKAKFVKLNVDDNTQVAQRFGIRSIPTLVVFKGGNESDRLIGNHPKEAISRMIDRALA